MDGLCIKTKKKQKTSCARREKIMRPSQGLAKNKIENWDESIQDSYLPKILTE